MLDKLIFYDNVRNDETVKKTVLLLDAIGSGAAFARRSLKINTKNLKSVYFDVQRALMSEYGSGAAALSGYTFWQRHVCRLIAESENVFSIAAENGEGVGCFGALAVREASVLKELYNIDWEQIAAAADDGDFCVAGMKAQPGDHGAGWVANYEAQPGDRAAEQVADCEARPGDRAAEQVADREARPGEHGAGGHRRSVESKRTVIHRALHQDDDAKTALMLAEYYRDEGSGLFERYDAFCWDHGLQGVERPDPITFEDLIGYEIQKERIIENVRFFTEGGNGLNMLLYGDRGTGKSSSVKALLNRFASHKLRLISVRKEDIDEAPAIMEMLARRGLRFIIFIDDLSFEENETGYKSFKSALEGGIRPQPENVMVCVTSNRRNIIKEVWRDREGAEDIHLNDSMQEKRSLADRFGLTVVFSTPDKSEYLDIVKGIAEREGMKTDMEELEREAMKWELRQNGRSGRGARQFINWFRRYS
ncbi:MAG: ATP-binding protein [Clostridiales Family XIII bacterium]|nr:ATP-binding protein [Clostridiales Family XIII bacterium]